jgi:hypothetical protein
MFKNSKNRNKLLSLIGFLILLLGCYKNEDEILALLKEVRAQNENLRVQVIKLQQTADSVSNALKLANNNISNIDKKVDSIKLQLSSVLTQINSLNLQMTQANANILDIQKKLSELQAKCTELYNLLLQYINGTKISVGDKVNGGIVFYVDSTGKHGLVAADQDQSSGGTEWGCYCTAITGTDTSFGKGATNTIKIVQQCSQANYAAKICDNLILNGFSDWYLPSNGELNLMYLNLKQKGIGNFSTTVPYWSSCTASYGSCGINGGAFTFNFSNGTMVSEYRAGYAGTGAVRAIRTF